MSTKGRYGLFLMDLRMSKSGFGLISCSSQLSLSGPYAVRLLSHVTMFLALLNALKKLLVVHDVHLEGLQG